MAKKKHVVEPVVLEEKKEVIESAEKKEEQLRVMRLDVFHDHVLYKKGDAAPKEFLQLFKDSGFLA